MLFAGTARAAACPASPDDLPLLRWSQDMEAKNLDDIMTLLAPDAVFVDPSGKDIEGQAALRAFYAQIFATYDSDITMYEGELSAAKDGSGCVEAGSYMENMTTRSDGTTKHIQGTYRFTYKEIQGHWLLTRQEWPESK